MGFPIKLISEQERYEYIKREFGFENTIFMGDGIFDVPIIKECKFGIAPANAREEAKAVARFITPSKSAEGAVCDACLEIQRRFLENEQI